MCLTLQRALRTLAALLSAHHVLVLAQISGESPHEAYLPTEQSSSSAYSRFPCAHGHQIRASGACSPSRQRPEASHRLSGSLAALAPVRLSTCQLRPDHSNQRNVSGINPNSIASTGNRVAPPTLASRSSHVTAVARFQDLDYRSPRASSVTPCGAIASSAWFENRFVSISMNCPPWTLSSMRVPALVMRTTLSLRAAWKNTGARS